MRTRLGAYIFPVLLSCLLALPVSAARGANITDTVVGAPNATDAVIHGGVSIDSTDSGLVAVAYFAQKSNLAWVIRVRTSSDGGATWATDPEIEVTASPLPVGSPRILLAADGTRHVFYVGTNIAGDTYYIIERVRAIADSSYSALTPQWIRRTSTAGGSIKDLAAKRDRAGNFYIAWAENIDTIDPALSPADTVFSWDVLMLKGSNAGASWTASPKICHAFNTTHQTQPAIAASESQVVVVMKDDGYLDPSTNPITQVTYSTSTDLGETWATEHCIHPTSASTGANQTDPCISAHGGANFRASFINTTAGKQGDARMVKYSEFETAANTLLSAVEDAANTRARPVAASLNDAEMHAFWIDENNLASGAAILTYAINAGGTAQPAATVSTAINLNTKSMDAAMSALGRTAHLAWLQKKGATGGTIRYARRSLDLAAPTGLTVTDDGATQYQVDTLRASWTAADPSGIRSYSYRVLERLGNGVNTIIRDWADAGTATSATVSFGGTLKDGYTYTFQVKATDNAFNTTVESAANAYSDGITIDLGLPTKVATVTVPPYISTNANITATWTPSVALGGIKTYEMALGSSGSTDGYKNMKGWTDVGNDLEGTLTLMAPKMVDGTLYYVSVRALNMSSNPGERSTSGPILVDLTPPTAIPAAYDDGTLTNKADQLRVTWDPATDTQSGIDHYEVAVGDTGTTANIAPWRSVGTTTSYVVRNLTLTDGEMYFLLIRPVNGAGSKGVRTATDGITLNKNLPDPGSAAIQPVTGLAIVRQDRGMKLTWTNPAINLNGIMVLRSTGAAVSDTPADGVAYKAGSRLGNATVVSVNTSKAEYIDTNLTPGTRYFYTVYAYAPGPLYSEPASANSTPLSFPVATATASVQNGVAPLTVQFTGTGSDSDGSIVRYEWDFDGNGLYEAVSNLGTATQTFREPASVNAVLRVTDDDGLTDTASIVINVSAPSGALALGAVSMSPSGGAAPVAIRFTVPAPTATIIGYRWSFGDGDTYGGPESRIVTHTYREPGTFQCKVTAITTTGLEDSTTVSVPVSGVSPAVTLSATPADGTAPLTVSLKATAAGADAAVRYEWDFDGNGVIDRVTAGKEIGFLYGEPGSWNPRVRVVAPGGVAGIGTTPVTVRNGSQAPSVFGTGANPRTGTIPLTVSFTVTASDNTGIAAYRWDFDGNGQTDLTTTAPTTVYQYTVPGQYHPTLQIVDADNLSRTVGFGEVLAEQPLVPWIHLVTPVSGATIGGKSTPFIVELISPNGPYSALVEGRMPQSPTWFILNSGTNPVGNRFTLFSDLVIDSSPVEVEVRARGTDRLGYGATGDTVAIRLGTQSARSLSASGSAGDRRIVAKVAEAQPYTLPIGLTAELAIPNGALVGNGSITGAEYASDVAIRSAGARSLAATTGTVSGAYIEASGVTLQSDMTLAIAYADADSDGRVDSTSIDETLLRAYRYNSTTGTWTEARRMHVDAIKNVVAISDTEFGAYALAVNTPTAKPVIDLAALSVNGGIATNGTTFYRNALFQSWLTAYGSGTYDVYVYLTLPNGTRMSYLGNYRFAAGYAPLVSNWTASTIRDALFMNILMPDLPLGNYSWTLLMTQTGVSPADATGWMLHTTTAFTVIAAPYSPGTTPGTTNPGTTPGGNTGPGYGFE